MRGSSSLTGSNVLQPYTSSASIWKAKLGDLYEPSFKLEYETRKESANFLGNIDLSLRELNIDYYFIASAYEYIEQYFTEKTQGERSRNGSLPDQTQ